MARDNTYISFYLSDGTCKVFTNAIRTLGNPKYVRFLINPVTLAMAMEEYGEKTFTSFKISKNMLGGRNCHGLRIYSKKFCDVVATRMGWDPKKSYRVPGFIYPEQKLVIYDLTSAKEIEARKNKRDSTES